MSRGIEPTTVDDVTYLPIAEPLDANGRHVGCSGCDANGSACHALPDCAGVVFVVDTPENRVKHIAWRMTT